MTPLIFATNCEYVEAVELLVDHCDIEARDSYGETAIFYASRLETTSSLQVLISAGCDVNAKSANYGQTPLIQAVLSGSVDHAKLLVSSGADVALKDHSGNTAFDHAMRESLHDEFLFLKLIS